MYSIPVSTNQTMLQPAKATVLVPIMAFVLLGTGSDLGIDRAEYWRDYIQPRVPFIVDAAPDNREHLDLRTPTAHIENVRSVLNPSVADLANLFNISRQAVYKWLSGDSAPEPDKLSRITELSRIADAFHAAGIERPEALLKMKTFGGRSLLDILKAGENSQKHVSVLISEAQAMEASYKRSGLATSKSKPTSDWLSTISIPSSSEHS
jgi:hypothetical protein